MINIEKFIERSNEAQDVEQLYMLLEDVLRDVCGYDRVIFSLLTDHPSLGLKSGHGVMRNYPDDWMKHYVESGYEHIDPVRRFGFYKVGPFAWDSLPSMLDLASTQRQCMDECREAGFYNGSAICLRGVAGELGGIGVASSSQKRLYSDSEVKRQLSLMNIIAQQFYTTFCALHEKKDMFEKQVILTSREMDILRHIALAKKDEAIACDLGITKHAVDFHVRNILKKLNAPNRMFAVLKAISNGLMNLDSAVFVKKGGG